MKFANDDKHKIPFLKLAFEAGDSELPKHLQHPPEPPTHPATVISSSADPHVALLQTLAPEPHRVLLGLTPTGFNLSAPRRNIAFLGAPRSNKSASVVTSAASYLGPLFVVTTRRFEFAQAIGHARARIAGPNTELVHIDLDGGASPLPGWTRRGWTPITTDVRTAYARAKAMTEAYEMGSTTNGSFWAVQATDVLYPLLLAAGLSRDRKYEPDESKMLGIEWVRATAKTGSEVALDIARNLLNAASKDIAGLQAAAESLEALDEMAPETKGSVLATASGALSAYALPDAVETTKLPLVDLEALGDS